MKRKIANAPGVSRRCRKRNCQMYRRAVLLAIWRLREERNISYKELAELFQMSEMQIWRLARETWF